MSDRKIWKAIHLLNNYGPDGLTFPQLYAAGVDCFPDSLDPLIDGGVLEQAGGKFKLTKAARFILLHCLLAQKTNYKEVVRVDYPYVFVVMPFGESWSNTVYDRVIEPAAKAAGLTCQRGDKKAQIGDLGANIWNEIIRAGLIIAEVSVPNANVFYELGLTHALGKDSLIMRQHGTKLPVDIASQLRCEYDLNQLVKARTLLKTQLQKWSSDQKAKRVKALDRP